MKILNTLNSSRLPNTVLNPVDGRTKDRNITYPISYVVRVVRVALQKKISKLAGRARFSLDEDREHKVSSSISIDMRSFKVRNGVISSRKAGNAPLADYGSGRPMGP